MCLKSLILTLSSHACPAKAFFFIIITILHCLSQTNGRKDKCPSWYLEPEKIQNGSNRNECFHIFQHRQQGNLSKLLPLLSPCQGQTPLVKLETHYLHWQIVSLCNTFLWNHQHDSQQPHSLASEDQLKWPVLSLMSSAASVRRITTGKWPFKNTSQLYKHLQSILTFTEISLSGKENYIF